MSKRKKLFRNFFKDDRVRAVIKSAIQDVTANKPKPIEVASTGKNQYEIYIFRSELWKGAPFHHVGIIAKGEGVLRMMDLQGAEELDLEKVLVVNGNDIRLGQGLLRFRNENISSDTFNKSDPTLLGTIKADSMNEIANIGKRIFDQMFQSGYGVLQNCQDFALRFVQALGFNSIGNYYEGRTLRTLYSLLTA